MDATSQPIEYYFDRHITACSILICNKRGLCLDGVFLFFVRLSARMFRPVNVLSHFTATFGSLFTFSNIILTKRALRLIGAAGDGDATLFGVPSFFTAPFPIFTSIFLAKRALRLIGADGNTTLFGVSSLFTASFSIFTSFFLTKRALRLVGGEASFSIFTMRDAFLRTKFVNVDCIWFQASSQSGLCICLFLSNSNFGSVSFVKHEKSIFLPLQEGEFILFFCLFLTIWRIKTHIELSPKKIT